MHVHQVHMACQKMSAFVQIRVQWTIRDRDTVFYTVDSPKILFSYIIIIIVVIQFEPPRGGQPSSLLGTKCVILYCPQRQSFPQRFHCMYIHLCKVEQATVVQLYIHIL